MTKCGFVATKGCSDSDAFSCAGGDDEQSALASREQRRHRRYLGLTWSRKRPKNKAMREDWIERMRLLAGMNSE